MKYSDALTIEAVPRTVWMVEYANGAKQLQIWHANAKIEDIVESVNNQNVFDPLKFTVSVVDVGMFHIADIHSMMSNGRKLNQDLEVEVG